MDSDTDGRMTMRTYDEVRLDCRCCGVDLLRGEWLIGVCRRCTISIDRLIDGSQRWGAFMIIGRRFNV